MTRFRFSFEEKKVEYKHELSHNVAGTCNVLTDTIKVYLPSIADTVTIYVPGFMTLFKQSFIDEVSDDCIKQINETLEHEYLHIGLWHIEYPLNKQHKAICAIEAMGDM